ncbi:MAG: hypothetical protein KGH65_00100 [Candidatus Micrarchaeota archaeon]|nr:hypothetical protein [Candidatus Micrarchaeota archaeon]
MLGQILKRKPIEESPSKAIKAYESQDPYGKDHTEIIIRTELMVYPESPKTLDEIVKRYPTPLLFPSVKNEVYGAILKFMDKGLVEAIEENGKMLYSLTKAGGEEGSWEHSLEFLIRIRKEYFKHQEEEDRKMRPWAYAFYDSKRDCHCDGD